MRDTRGHAADAVQPRPQRDSLGYGEVVYEQAKAAVCGLRLWDVPWIELCATGTQLADGLILATLTRQFGIWHLNPCRVVYIDADEPDRRYGFAYGTIQGHVERGEERFTVERRQDDSVWYSIAAFSRPARLITFAGYPLVRRLQRRFAVDSMEAMRRLVAASPHRQP